MKNKVYNNKKKVHKELQKFRNNEEVVVETSMHLYHTPWAIENGFVVGSGRYIGSNNAKVVKIVEGSGNLYYVVDVDGDLFEVFHKHLNKK